MLLDWPRRVLLIYLLLHLGSLRVECCQNVTFESDSFVCACNSSYCDTFPQVTVEPGKFVQIVSNQLSSRFQLLEGTLGGTPQPNSTLIAVNLTESFQIMHGFGGAFTDATGINIAQLSVPAQEKLIESYFGSSGIEYTIGRIPMAGCDFSTHPYSYDDVEEDVDLEFFSLTEEDYLYKLPYIKWAQNISTRDILLFGSPWSPPAWMKESGRFNGSGGLRAEMWQPYSNYFVKFVEAYESEGAPIWGLTPQNEPLTGFQDWMWNTCAWNASAMRDWIKMNLGPTLEAAGMRRIKLMVLDHNRDGLPWYPDIILADNETYSYVDGIALHWYADEFMPASVMNLMHDNYPEKFMLYTESCEGWHGIPGQQVVLGSWERAENYAHNIIQDVNHWATGWVDWNMALDVDGGPNWANNFVDSPVIVDKDQDLFYKQPMFYAMGHFSKFVTTGDVRISTSVSIPEGEVAKEGQYDEDAVHEDGDDGDDDGDDDDNLLKRQNVEAAAFLKGDGSTVVIILLNRGDAGEPLSIQDTNGNNVNLFLEPHSLHTILYNP